MSTHHSADWHDGHGVGYLAAEEDLVEWIDETLREWKGLKVYTHEELWAAQEILRELEKRLIRAEE